MKIEEYQALAMRTSADGHDRILNGCMGLIGESGEIVDIVKKWKFQSGDHARLPKDEIINECGDVLWYCAELMTGLKTDFSSAINTKHELKGISEINEKEPLENTVMRLSTMAAEPARLYLNKELGINCEDDNYTSEETAKLIIHIIVLFINDILEIHCTSTLLKAMELNIEKLRRRYPDGFDPERSLHRTE